MNKKLYKMMDWAAIEGIVYSEESNPYAILGPHVRGTNCLFQAFYPEAKKMELVIYSGKETKTYAMEEADEAGFFAQIVPGKIPEKYEYIITTEKKQFRWKDIYSFKGYEINKKDNEKLIAGTHNATYEILGAHSCKVKDVEGTRFAVWAPYAVRVSVVGDFNDWNPLCAPMEKNSETGVFELFIPDVEEGSKYQYDIKFKSLETVRKSDPYGRMMTKRPNTESIVFNSNFRFDDKDYLEKRAKLKKKNIPISIYECYLGNFKRSENDDYLNYRELAPIITKYVNEMGYTHVELMPVMEHSLDASWGYQAVGYYAPSSRFGNPDDFKFFVDYLHKNDIGVILDCPFNHFPKDSNGMSNFDGTCLYEHLDPKKGIHPFYGTCLYNYARPEVADFLISNALYYIKEYHIDGLKLDSVSSMLYLDYGRRDGEWISNIYGGNENLEAIEFIKKLNMTINKLYPDVLMIAEEDSSYPKVTLPVKDGGLGFDYKFNQGLVNDYLDYISFDPYFRSHHHNELTFSMVYQYSESFINAFSHDCFIYGKGSMYEKMPGEDKDRFAGLRLTYAYMMAHPGAKLIFEGQDFGDNKEFDENVEISWDLIKKAQNKGLKQMVKDLNKLYKSVPALSCLDNEADGFEWINSMDSQRCIVSFMRKTKIKEETMFVIANFANQVQELSVGTPLAGKYKEIFNSDSKDYGGNDILNRRAKAVSEFGADGKPYSFNIKMAPLSLCIFKYVPFTEKEKFQIQKRKEAEIAKTNASKFHEELLAATAEMEEAKIKMEEWKNLMQLAKDKAQNAKEKEEVELLKAKKAIDEANMH